VNVNIRLFARARDLVGVDTLSLDVPEGATVGAVREELLRQHPALEVLSSHLLVAVGTEYATDDAAIAEGADVSVFPPVSGG
jgi:molybdopterin converting factor subunit 1